MMMHPSIEIIVKSVSEAKELERKSVRVMPLKADAPAKKKKKPAKLKKSSSRIDEEELI
jgi:hypothetical protein